MLARRSNSQALLLAGDTVSVSIQVGAIARVALVQRRCPSSLSLLAVGVELLLRLRLGGCLLLGALPRARVTATEPAAPARRVVRRLRSASSESAEPSLPESCCDSAGAVEDGASLLVLAVSSQPASPTPRTRARSTGAEVLSSPRRFDVEEDTDETDERENMGGIGDKKGAFTRASSQEKGWWAASR